MPMYDFRCNTCNLEFDEIVLCNVNTIDCPVCGTLTAERIFITAPKLLTNIIPSYPGCKKHKAGYVHTHADRNATKISSGYGGCQGPK